MNQDQYHPGFHKLAISTIFVALTTLIFGALTTTKNAGMAFPDWPTSDGHFMITYPWLKDYAVRWDKFLEHGHRLAGILIGIWSIALVVTAQLVEKRPRVKWLAISILLGVICQGALGGFRVQLNDRGLAMLHGIFAAIVFSLMGTLVVVTGKRWREAAKTPISKPLTAMKVMAVTALGLLCVQYVFGSLIRHRGTGLHEHLGIGILFPVVAFVNAIISQKCESSWLRRSSWTLLGVASLQVALGLATWVLKYGFAATGYVAVADSTQQVIVRTVHMVWGVITLMTAVVHTVKVYRVAAVSPATAEPTLEIRRSSSSQQPPLAQPGGAG